MGRYVDIYLCIKQKVFQGQVTLVRVGCTLKLALIAQSEEDAWKKKELCLRYFERRWGRTKVKRVHREAKKNVRDVIFVASDIDTVLHIYIDCACHILPD